MEMIKKVQETELYRHILGIMHDFGSQSYTHCQWEF
jgi:hypothetical protein